MNPQVVFMQKTADHRFGREQGQTLLMFVLFMIVLFTFMGLGIDFGFAYVTRARLSKAVDAAALTGMRSLGQGQAQATIVAQSAFSANYGTSGRDVAAPVPNITFSMSNSNTTIDVKASVSINTFFLRALSAMPFYSGASWKTLSVGDEAIATRANLIMALVLDDSGSMLGNGGAGKLPGAVSGFISQFSPAIDQVAMVTFDSGSSVAVPMEYNFVTDIENAVNAMTFPSTTCSDQGLTNGLAQIENTPTVAGENVIKVMVFFTDGMCNTFNYVFDCGTRDIDYNDNLYDPATGNSSSTGCTLPPKLSSIDPSSGNLTANAVDPSSCDAMHTEAQNRAERIAWLFRSQSPKNIIYSIGMGTPGGSGECNNGNFPILNPDFLKDVANTTDAPDYVSGQPSGDYAIAANSGELEQVFQTIASKILLRLSK
jgi:Flp pilus assembly protein TadG